ncbi:extracellular solute-binding protein [Alkalibacterium olivapovliticus]|uniref:Putative aldouronate transport system substrate-binding protein n=1 Tax=Alkalibacterium olivapovliticus TaxID=99907 RepID=A0A2T0W6A0_9LACT|nr:extracellular solute-binding protein [Alkalibacterium olivapovliticus]PRY82238.1 putative aldouronate transport system substrate-binding protein [Alkalibacterium olivapovliticus]
MRSLSKKYLLTSATLCGALLLAACNGDATGSESEEEITEDDIGSVGAMESFEVGDTFVATEPLDIGILYRDLPAYPLETDWMFFQELEENNNVTFDITSVPLSDWEERLNVTMGAGDLPDYSTDIWSGHETPYVPSGTVLPISDYTHLMPHFQQRLEDWEGVNEQIENMRQLDGKYYVLPGINENIQFDFSMKYNQTVFEEYGIEEPQSWDELRDALVILRDETGTTPLTLWWQGNATFNFGGGSFDTIGGWGSMDGAMYDPDTEEFVYAPMQQGYKDMIEYFAGLTEDGLMDPEALTQDDQMARGKLINQEAFVSSGNIGTITDVNEGLDDQYGEGEFEFSRLPILAGPNGQVMRGGNTNSGIMLSADVAERDDFLALLQYIDWQYYSDEGTEFAHWGVEGETFEYTDDLVGGYKPVDGIRYERLNVGAPESLQEDYGFGNAAFAYAGPAHIRQSIMEEKEFNYQTRMNEEVEILLPDPPRPMSPADQEQASLLSTPLLDTVDQYTFRFVTGQYSMDRWDEFMEELEAQNVDAFMELVNEAYADYQEAVESATE